MSANRWKEVTAAFNAAVEKPPAERAAFLAAACAGDSWLRREVETLLACHEDGGDTASFAGEALDALGRPPGETLARGARLGRYVVEGHLGAGGMGAVYRARDETLGRAVAVKVLPPHLAGDAAAMRRFQQEARLASSLNHPNIVTVYEIGSEGDVPYIATELIEGVTLRARVRPAGIPLDEVVPLALQAASALAAAHAAGVVHRDVKPENVMVRPDGLVKVLDFGLAEPAPDGAPAKPAGLVMGTVSYMSPEQARGREVDGRSDVWSLGVVVYELLSGRKPFEGATGGDVIAGVLERTPRPLDAVRQDAPALWDIVARCLCKDPSERFRSGGDLLAALQALPAGPPHGAGRTRRADPRGWAAAALLATAIAVLGVTLRGGREPAAVPRRDGGAAALRMAQVTRSGNVIFAAASPDGASLAYVMEEEGGLSSVWIRSLDGTREEALVPPEEAEYRGVQFSPDGRSVYVTADFGNRDVYILSRVPAAGGPRQEVARGVHSGVTFAPGGTRMAFVRRVSANETRLVVAEADGGGERVLLTAGAPGLLVEVAPAWSPDGRAIAVTRVAATGTALEVLAVDSQDGSSRILGGRSWRWVGNPVWEADGSAVIVPVAGAASTAAQIVRLPHPEGTPVELTHDVNSYLSVSGTGRPGRFFAVRRELISSVWVSEAASGEATKVTRGEGKYFYNLGWTPTGRIVCSSDESGGWNLWEIDPASRAARRLTSGVAIDAAPDVSADGRHVVFQSTRGASRNLWVMQADGAGLRQLTFGGGEYNPQAAPQGWVAYTSYDGGAAAAWRVPIEGGAPVPLADGVLRDPTISSDGRWVAGHYQAGPGRPWRIGVFAAAGGGGPAREVELPGAGAGWQIVRWVPGRDALSYLVARGDVHDVWTAGGGGPPRQVTHFDSGRIFSYAWSRDGRRLALIRGVYNRDIVEVTAPRP